jgi:hypothetical protein
MNTGNDSCCVGNYPNNSCGKTNFSMEIDIKHVPHRK